MSKERLTVEVDTATSRDVRSRCGGRRHRRRRDAGRRVCRASSGPRTAGDPRLHERGLHQLDRDRADRAAPGGGPRDHREVIAEGLSDHYREIFRITRLSDYRRSPTPVRDVRPRGGRLMTDTTVDVTRRHRGDPAGPRRDHRGQRAAGDGRLCRGRRGEVDRARLQRPRLHEQRWHRAPRHPARPHPARGPAPARRRPLGALPPDPRADALDEAIAIHDDQSAALAAAQLA